jgi:hypothetical protein
MRKYLMIWNLNLALTPVNPKERGAGFELLLSMVKQDIKKGLSKEQIHFREFAFFDFLWDLRYMQTELIGARWLLMNHSLERC